MHKLFAGFILMIVLPMVGNAQAPSAFEPSPIEPAPAGSNPGESLREKSTGSADEQEAFNICLRATQRFEQQERAKGNKKPGEAPISASCKKELKPVAYWQCMDKEAMQDVDFNTAHSRCAKQTNIQQ